MSRHRDESRYRIDADGQERRLCKCGYWKPYTLTYFYARHGKLQSDCKVCQRAQSAQWLREHRKARKHSASGSMGAQLMALH